MTTQTKTDTNDHVADDPGKHVGGDISAAIEATRGADPAAAVAPDGADRSDTERNPDPITAASWTSAAGDPSDSGAPAG